MRSVHDMRNEQRVAAVQGAVFVSSGVWPIVHLRSFEAVTGPKPEGWLVRTVGSLLAVIGGVLLSSARRDRITPEVRGLAVGSALTLAVVDVVGVGIRRIAPVYLLDAALETGLAVAWWRAGRGSRGLGAHHAEG